MNKPHPEMRETEYLVVGAGAAGCAFGFLMERAGAAAFAGKASYEEAMKPHVEFVQKNSKKSKQYYAAAYSVISGFGIKR